MLDVGVGVIDVNPTNPFRFGPCTPETGRGAANWVLEVVLTVDAGAGIVNWLAAGCGAGVADWNSSNSSSSSIGLDSRISRPLLLAGFLPAAVDVEAAVTGSSSPKSNKSCSGSLGGSGFFASCFGRGGLLPRRRAGLASSSSYSSYSSNRFPLRPASWNSLEAPPKPPPSP